MWFIVSITYEKEISSLLFYYRWKQGNEKNKVQATNLKTQI